MASTDYIAAFRSAPLLGPAKPSAGKPETPAAGSPANPVSGAALDWSTTTLPPLSLSAALPSWAGPAAIAAALVIALTMLRSGSRRGRH